MNSLRLIRLDLCLEEKMHYSLFPNILVGGLLTVYGQSTTILSNKDMNLKSTFSVNETLPLTKSASQIALEKIQEKHDILFTKVVEAFAENDKKKKKFLCQPYKKLPEIGNCYLETYGTFLTQCCSINHYEKLGKFKNFFHRICAVDWLKTEDIWRRIEEICDTNEELKI